MGYAERFLKNLFMINISISNISSSSSSSDWPHLYIINPNPKKQFGVVLMFVDSLWRIYCKWHIGILRRKLKLTFLKHLISNVTMDLRGNFIAEEVGLTVYWNTNAIGGPPLNCRHTSDLWDLHRRQYSTRYNENKEMDTQSVNLMERLSTRVKSHDGVRNRT